MLYKREGSPNYYIKIKSAGSVVRRSTGTANKARARAAEKHLRHELWRLKHASSSKTFDQAVERWISESQHKKSLSTDLMILEWFAEHLGGVMLAEINADRIRELREMRDIDSKKSTTNRYMALLRSILNKAAGEWEWIDKAPKVPMHKKPLPDPRFLSLDEWMRLAAQLPPHTLNPAWFAVCTGLRTKNIQRLKWSWVQRDGLHFPASVMKNDAYLTIPLSQTAWHVLAEQWGQDPECVFLNHKGKPWSGKFATAAWRKAVKRAGLEGATFHDLRHTFASWAAQRGVPLDVVRKLGGWRSREAMEIYARFAPATLAEWV